MFCLYFYYIYFPLLFRYFSKKTGGVVRPQMFTATKKIPLHLRKVAVYSAIWQHWTLFVLLTSIFTISPLFDITSRHIELCNRVISHKE